MAKHSSGLPEGFDLNVTSDELVGGPAKIPGYLDTDPVITLLRAQQETQPAATPPVRREVPPQATNIPSPTPAPRPVAITPPPPIVATPEVRTTEPAIDRKRLQINLDAESKRMLADLVELTSSQSRGYQIKVSEVIQALLSILHKARNDIVLGPLPPRGRWGTQSQRTFHTALAEAFREAIVAYEQASGGNPFKNVSNR